MTSINREDYYDFLYSQAINASLNLNLNRNTNMQRHWRPINGVGEISYEYLIGNYMIDSNKCVGLFYN